MDVAISFLPAWLLITFIASSLPDGGEEDDERRAADDIASRHPPPPPHLPPPELCHDFEMIAADKKRELSRSLHLISTFFTSSSSFILAASCASSGR